MLITADDDDADDDDDVIRIVLDCAAERIRDILMQAQQVGMMTGDLTQTSKPSSTSPNHHYPPHDEDLIITKLS